MAAGIRARERPDVYEALAGCYLATGAPTKGIALLERCLAATASDPILQTRYRTQLALALHTSGDTQRARTLVEQAAALAESSPPRACASTTTAPSPKRPGRSARRSRRSPTPGARSLSWKRSRTPTSSPTATASAASSPASNTSGNKRSATSTAPNGCSNKPATPSSSAARAPNKRKRSPGSA